MEFKTLNFEEEADFQDLLNKMHTTQLNSTFLESPSSSPTSYDDDLSYSGSPGSPRYLKSPRYRSAFSKHCLNNTPIKPLNIASGSQKDEHFAEEQEDFSGLEELDLNKTYSSKTMDHRQLSQMLAALAEDEED